MNDDRRELVATPDLLTLTDGKPVTAAPAAVSADDGTSTNWERRREELYNAIIPNEYGGMPPRGEATELMRLSSYTIKPEQRITYETFEVRTTFTTGAVSFVLQLWIPEGKGPFPVVLAGDGCWRFFNDAVVNEAVERGYIAALFNRTTIAADNPDRYRDSGICRVIPDASFGALAAWAWAYHRSVDALTAMEFVRPEQIAITGHSRGGKTVLLAAATDTRIALANPHCSGTGGSGLNRLKGEGAEVIDDFNKSRNIFWFGEGFKEYAGRDQELPYDQHYLHALVAPRALFVTEARDDVWANPPGSYAACLAARRVYDMLGAKERIGWSLRDGGHDQNLSDLRLLLDFLDHQFGQHRAQRDYQPVVFPDLVDAFGGSERS